MSLLRIVIVSAVILSLLSELLSQGKRGNKCRSLDGGKGVCRPIHECPVALKALKMGSMTTRCGLEGHTPIVCCAYDHTWAVTPKPKPAAILPTVTPGGNKKSKNSLHKVTHVSSTPEPIRSDVISRVFADKVKKLPGPKKSLQASGIPHMESQHCHQRGNQAKLRLIAAVGFGKQNDIRWECGGSLISEKFVLTAAHCLTARDGSRAKWVLLGAKHVADKHRGYSVSTDGIIYHVIQTIRHPGYMRKSKYNDIALLELGPSLEFDKTSNIYRIIRPACLQVEWDPNLKTAIASGWGRLGHGANPSSSLQKVHLNILNPSICNEKYAAEITLTKLNKGVDESMICAGDLAGGKDTCQGDSGGPLVIPSHDDCDIRIIGVTSFGKVCGFPGSPAVYMRISHFVPWIESIVWPE